MNDTIEVIIEGLLAQKDKLEAVILELNSLETEYAKDTKIINDRIDNLVLKDNEILDKFRQDLDDINNTITSLQAVSIDLSPYATLDDVRQAINNIKIPDMPKVIKGIDGKDAEIDYSIVEAQIKEYILTNRDRFKGKDGITPSDEKIQTIVNQWLNDNKESLKGEKGDSIKGDSVKGKDGLGIDTITYKNNTIYITLTDGSKKDFKLPVQFVGGGGGIGENRVREIIAQSGTSPDLQNRAEIESLYKVAYSTSYSEITYNLGNISEINIWDTSLKGTLLFTKSLTYVEGNITQIDITDHLQNKTLTKELSYNNGNIISINKVIL